MLLRPPREDGDDLCGPEFSDLLQRPLEAVELDHRQ
jgi:hypothetical protein